jgi:hypothetical protein
MLKVLAFGDIMGKIGRRALAQKLPELRKKYEADLVIANCENLAHGCGITTKTIQEMFRANVDFCTSGNHIFDKEAEFKEVLKDKELKSRIIRPANYKSAERKPGAGYSILKIGKEKVLIINLLGQIFMKDESDKVKSPLIAFDEILKKTAKEKVTAIIVDLHAEATSEKRAFGWYADGRASLVWGTHTHTPTADSQILPQGTGYVTDLGMVGAKNSVIGENKDAVIAAMKAKDKKLKHNIPEEGPAIICGIYAEIDRGKTIKIEQIIETVA